VSEITKEKETTTPEPVEFTEEELEFIKKVLNREEVKKAIYWDNDMLPPKEISIEERSIARAIKYRHDNLGGMGRERHELMWSIFRKFGLGPMGELTIEEYEQNKKDEKVKQLLDLQIMFRKQEKVMRKRIQDILLRKKELKLVKEANDKSERDMKDIDKMKKRLKELETE
jgi:hypothetical protein